MTETPLCGSDGSWHKSAGARGPYGRRWSPLPIGTEWVRPPAGKSRATHTFQYVQCPPPPSVMQSHLWCSVQFQHGHHVQQNERLFHNEMLDPSSKWSHLAHEWKNRADVRYCWSADRPGLKGPVLQSRGHTETICTGFQIYK